MKNIKWYKKVILYVLGIGTLGVMFYQYYDETQNVWLAIGLCVLSLISLMLIVALMNWLTK